MDALTYFTGQSLPEQMSGVSSEEKRHISQYNEDLFETIVSLPPTWLTILKSEENL